MLGALLSSYHRVLRLTVSGRAKQMASGTRLRLRSVYCDMAVAVADGGGTGYRDAGAANDDEQVQANTIEK